MYELLVDNSGVAEADEAATVWATIPPTEEAGELEKVWARFYGAGFWRIGCERKRGTDGVAAREKGQ